MDRDGLLCNNIKTEPDCPNSQPPCNHLEPVPSANSDIQSVRYCSLCLVVGSDRGKSQTHHRMRFLLPHAGTKILSALLGHFTTGKSGSSQHIQEMITEQCHFVTGAILSWENRDQFSRKCPRGTTPLKCSSLQSLSAAVPPESPFLNHTSKNRVPAVILR